ncbi:helix-turn-helix domain-containing protein [Enterococcus massiliensis]|uniref:helix-turn-helix domain-containing protein n=1 Tax=Enterococcus massiliensis TaxID=1640685 RepID=UPI0009E65839|nr:helix-turn-helix transcriptional regulator [Enterococcus massiliensis]
MDIQIKVGLRIKELRHSNNLTQESLANKVGVDRTYINSVENGRRNISIKVLEKIVIGFNMTIYDFFNNELFWRD